MKGLMTIVLMSIVMFVNAQNVKEIAKKAASLPAVSALEYLNTYVDTTDLTDSLSRWNQIEVTQQIAVLTEQTTQRMQVELDEEIAKIGFELDSLIKSDTIKVVIKSEPIDEYEKYRDLTAKQLAKNYLKKDNYRLAKELGLEVSTRMTELAICELIYNHLNN